MTQCVLLDAHWQVVVLELSKGSDNDTKVFRLFVHFECTVLHGDVEFHQEILSALLAQSAHDVR